MNNNTSLEQFLAQATNTLAETERQLDQLAQAALLNQEQVRRESGDNHPLAAHLQQVSQQLARLSERSQHLSSYLQNGLDKPPVSDDDRYWPLIRVLQSQEEEQTQLARELEDLVGQLLANSVFELASCRHLLNPDDEAVSVGLDSLQNELEQGLSDVRWFITGLEPTTIIGNFGLGGGVRRYLEKFKERTNLEVQLHIKANFGRLPSIIEVAVFRVIQETLSNVAQHAQATQVEIEIKECGNTLEFTVTDNGRGVSADSMGTSHKNLGLARMVDYAELLKGNLKIFSQPNQGTKVVLSIPYPIL